MTHVRQSVVGVVIFSSCFLRAQFGKYLRGSTHACILREPEVCFFDEI